jgi:hypothetical protein
MGKCYVFAFNFAVFGLLVTLKPITEAKGEVKLSHTLKPNDFGRYGAS